MIKLSVVIITFNEEKNIGRCIDSVHEIADDIVVVDSFSTDKTEDICKDKGVRFVSHGFEGHIEQKNWAITQAKYPHVLSLDADEALDEKLRSSINETKVNWHADGYTMNRLTNYCGKWIRHTGWYPDRKLRLWDSRLGRWTGINPHDRYELKNESKILHLQGDILHYSYYSISDHIKQVNYFTEIAANASFAAGKKSSLFKILFSPVFKFIRDYFFKLGFLDGYYGFVISAISSQATFIKYVKLKQLYSNSKKS
jgi:glycosyltransferase involved in cell wall biosynthesis